MLYLGLLFAVEVAKSGLALFFAAYSQMWNCDNIHSCLVHTVEEYILV